MKGYPDLTVVGREQFGCVWLPKKLILLYFVQHTGFFPIKKGHAATAQ